MTTTAATRERRSNLLFDVAMDSTEISGETLDSILEALDLEETIQKQFEDELTEVKASTLIFRLAFYKLNTA